MKQIKRMTAVLAAAVLLMHVPMHAVVVFAAEEELLTEAEETMTEEAMEAAVPVARAGWVLDNNGWWYRYADGSWPASKWEQIGDVWYYFNSAGYMHTGWLWEGGNWYYLEDHGGMKTGWLWEGGHWYYLEETGAMKTGWIKLDATWYYLEDWGGMKTGWLKSGAYWYYLEDHGGMKTGWAKVDGNWYYLDASGAMQTGWLKDGGEKYYLDPSGIMLAGWHTIDGVNYYFNENGQLEDDPYDEETTAVLGIDVSSYQGVIDWNRVRASGIEFAIIRCGYRTYGSGKLMEDTAFDRNMQGALAAGVKVGVYVYSSAINTAEALEEAYFALNKVRGYHVQYPVFIDMESPSDGRALNVSYQTRTDIVKAFCSTVQASGYRAGVYANKSWFNSYMNTPELTQYSIWLAHWVSAEQSDYSRTRHDLWQYTSYGTVPGINGRVDMDLSYVRY